MNKCDDSTNTGRSIEKIPSVSVPRVSCLAGKLLNDSDKIVSSVLEEHEQDKVKYNNEESQEEDSVPESNLAIL